MAPIDVLRKEVKKYVDMADEKSLRIVKAVLEIEQEDAEADDTEENWDDLPQELQTTIDEAIKQIDDGGGTPHEEVVAKYYSQWFRR